MEELAKHRLHKEREHHPHHHMHLFHLPGHHHKEQHQQQAVAAENYRAVSSAIDEPTAHVTTSSSSNMNLTVGRVVWRWWKMKNLFIRLKFALLLLPWLTFFSASISSKWIIMKNLWTFRTTSTFSRLAAASRWCCESMTTVLHSSRLTESAHWFRSCHLVSTSRWIFIVFLLT